MRNSIFVLALVLAACNNQPPAEEASATGGSGSEETSALSAQRMVDVAPRGGSDESCALETVYFAFDSSDLSSASRNAIESAVTCLRASGRHARLHVTGATDPEGTEEYNLALGERRAHAVRSYLAGLGVESERVSTASVGEEMATGTDEASWARDRHASTRVSN